ncbi:MAG: RimK family alpha-L-glutamate ligase [Candidatus Lokiarchaeota archaeon]|nr:RimK family alpha-L-glutamate ligase [Candidatus Lokiarchaeota archaeon]
MPSMIITPKPDDPEVQTLSKEFESRGYDVRYFIPSTIKVKINISQFEKQFENLDPYGALVRGFGAAPTQKIFFRLDLLNAIEEYGLKLINSRESLEIASDKFLTSIYLEKHKIPTPRTIVCENPNDALESFEELGGDIVLKPLYGSKGVGITRINDKGFAENIFYTLSQLHEVFYLQEFIKHPNRDIRILVLGNEAIAGMYRVSDNWKTNISAGARSEPLELSEELTNLAIKAAKITKTEIAGVDIVESEEGLLVLEVNSIPGFTALQNVTEINLAEEIVSYFLKNI